MYTFQRCSEMAAPGATRPKSDGFSQKRGRSSAKRWWSLTPPLLPATQDAKYAGVNRLIAGIVCEQLTQRVTGKHTSFPLNPGGFAGARQPY